MNEVTLQTLLLNGIHMRVAVQGRGPLVLLCHGFPESWCSWRHQLAALASAGYRAVAPDMRGYGGTDAPPDVASYTMLHHVGDMTELVHALGETQAVIVGHDWGAAVAWSAALLRPDIFRAVVGLSVPFSPPSGVNLLDALEKQGIKTFHMQYFQTPGVVESELGADPEASLRRLAYSMSGNGPGRVVAGVLAPGAGFLETTVEPDVLPAWLDREDLAYVAREFSRTGFRGGLNRYRSMALSTQLLAPWRGAIIHQPSLFVAGTRDDVLKFPSARSQIDHFPTTLPGLRGCHILDGAGHWIQRERAAAVNELLLAFMAGL